MRILSGLKPTSCTHLGNYFGAIRQWIALQSKGEAFYFIADLHALNQVRDATQLRALRRDVATDFLALGLEPNQATIFNQTDVPEVSELQWILGTVTPMGLLQRAHAYKDALAKGDDIDFGLFAYPVLMAADILLYDSDTVPVGKDQTQHIEMTRDMAVKFNRTYCPDFDPKTGEGGALRLPGGYILDDVAVVPGIDGRKMSSSYGNFIPLFDSDKAIKKRVMSVVTDSTPVEAPKDPDTCNVYGLLTLVSAEAELAELRDRYIKAARAMGSSRSCSSSAFTARLTRHGRGARPSLLTPGMSTMCCVPARRRHVKPQDAYWIVCSMPAVWRRR